MTFRRLIGIVIPLLVGVAAARWTPLSIWIDMKEGLIAFLGFLAASLVQVMPITANFLQADQLNPQEAVRLTASLTKQQRYWMGLLSSTIFAMVLVIVSAAMKDYVSAIWFHNMPFALGIDSILVFFVTGSLSFVLMKMLGLFEGMMSLHHLRGELVINAAKRNAAEKSASMERDAKITRPIVPANYGEIIRPH